MKKPPVIGGFFHRYPLFGASAVGRRHHAFRKNHIINLKKAIICNIYVIKCNCFFKNNAIIDTYRIAYAGIDPVSVIKKT